MLNEDRANKINQIWSHVGGKDKINLSSKNCIVQKAQAHTHTPKLKHRPQTNTSFWSEHLISFRIYPLSQSIDSPLGLRPQCLDSQTFATLLHSAAVHTAEVTEVKSSIAWAETRHLFSRGSHCHPFQHWLNLLISALIYETSPFSCFESDDSKQVCTRNCGWY